MGALIANVAKGKFARYADLPAASDKLVWVVFTGAATDATLRDVATLTAAIALSDLDEATFTGYSRQDAVGAAASVDHTNDWMLVDVTTDPSWNPTSAQAITRIGLFYDPDGSNTAANMIPLFFDDFAMTTPTTGTITYQVATGGFGKAA